MKWYYGPMNGVIDVCGLKPLTSYEELGFYDFVEAVEDGRRDCSYCCCCTTIWDMRKILEMNGGSSILVWMERL